MRIKSLAVALLASPALLLAACSHKQPPKPQNQKPAQAVLADARLLRQGDFDGLMRNALPPADYQAMRKRWNSDHTVPARITARDRKRFAETMRELTQPGAKAKLFAQLQPKLNNYRSKYQAQMPMMTGIAQTLINTELDKRMDLSNTQRAQTKKLVATLADWLRNAPWGDQDKARQAVGITVDTARDLHVKQIDQIYAMDYKQSMQAWATLWKGVRQLFELYGLSLDQALDSVQAKTVSQQGDQARVQVDYTVRGKPMQATLNMVHIGKGWYDSGLLNYLRRAPTAPGTAGSAAPAATATTAAATVAADRPATASTAPATAGSTH